jgi:hypothetical protein
VLAGVLALSGATACTPAQDKQVAVAVVQGRLTFLPGLCSGEAVTRVYAAVYQGDRDGADPLQQWSADAGRATDRSVEVDSGALPAGWSTFGGPPPALRAGVRYYVSIDTVHDGNLLHTGVVEVDGTVLVGLAPDQVYAAKGGVMTAAAFRAKAAKGC